MKRYNRGSKVQSDTREEIAYVSRTVPLGESALCRTSNWLKMWQRDYTQDGQLLPLPWCQQS
jgi:hypothetical protein